MLWRPVAFSFFCYGGRARSFFCYGGRARFFAVEAGRVFLLWRPGAIFFCCGGRARCEDAPRKSAILGEIGRTLHTRTRFCAKMQGHCSISERNYKDAPRRSAILRENMRTLHTRARFCAKIRGRSTRERNSQ